MVIFQTYVRQHNNLGQSYLMIVYDCLTGAPKEAFETPSPISKKRHELINQMAWLPLVSLNSFEHQAIREMLEAFKVEIQTAE